MTDRCRCFSILSRDSWCSVHGDVDAILASGTYADRKGRVWKSWEDFTGDYVEWIAESYTTVLTPDRMRLKIVRDLHRDECPGLRECFTHPVPQVFTDEDGDFCAYPALGMPDLGTWHPTLGVALDAARHMTGETP